MKRLLLLAFICTAIRGVGQTDHFYHTIDSLVLHQQFQTATNLLQQSIDETPGRYYDHAQAYLLISQIDLRLGLFDQAMASNQQSMELRERLRTDDIAENFTQLGAIYLRMSQYDQALNALNQAKELPFEDPQLFARINSLLAHALAEKKEFGKALECLEQSLKLLQIDLEPDHPEVGATYFRISKLYQQKGQLEEAGLYFQKGLAIELKRADSLLLRALPNNFVISILQSIYEGD